MSEPDQESWTECIFCAGTGKVRDYHGDVTPFAAGTSFTVDPALFGNYDFYAICGT